MKKIEIIKNCDQNEVKMSLMGLGRAINNPKQLVVARNGEGFLFPIICDEGFYSLIDNERLTEASYQNLEVLTIDYEIFLVD